MNKISKIFRDFVPEYLDTVRILHAYGASQGDQCHSHMPNGCSWPALLRMREMWRNPRRLPVLRQSTLPGMPEPQNPSVDGSPDEAATARPPLYGDIYSAFRIERYHPQYAIMFAASSQAMAELIAKGRHIKGETSLASLESFTPREGRSNTTHIFIIWCPVEPSQRAIGIWSPTGDGFFLPVKALSALYRGKFKALMEKAGWLHLVCPDVWNNSFNVNSHPAGNGEQCIKYLTPYIFKVAISQH